MKNTMVFALAMAGAAYGQSGSTGNATFQYFATADSARAGMKTLTYEGVSNTLVKGKPFSATEERHTLQTLGDGTRIENTDTNKIFRDDQGRVRIERPDGSVLIQDPGDGSSTETSANGQKSRRSTMVFHYVSGDEAGTPQAMERMKMDMAKTDAEMAHRKAEGDAVIQIRRSPVAVSGKLTAVVSEKAPEVSLGFQSVNGVSAEGKRSVIDIPMGQIGNNRDIQVVSERWYSNDLQMTVKTLNSDPRFGETTYQLTNIVQGAQDPALFAMPTEPPHK